MFARSVLLAVTLLSAPIAMAQTEFAQEHISENTLKMLKALAWQSLPTKIIQGQRVVGIDKSDPSKIIIPDADAREVIRVARLTARAHKCDLQDLVIANRDAFLLREKKTGRWTESQLQYINTLHLFTVQLFVARIEEEPRPEPDSDGSPSRTKVDCSEKEKADILSAVEANEETSRNILSATAGHE